MQNTGVHQVIRFKPMVATEHEVSCPTPARDESPDLSEEENSQESSGVDDEDDEDVDME